MPKITDYEDVSATAGPSAPSDSTSPGKLTDYTEIGDDAPREQSWIARHTPDSAVKLAQGVQEVEQSIKGLGNLATGGGTGKADRDLHAAIAKKYGEQAAEALAPIKTLGQANKELGQDLSAKLQADEKDIEDAQGFWNTAGAYARHPMAALGSAVEAAPNLAAGVALGPVGAGVQAAGTSAQNVLDKNPDNIAGAYEAAPIAGVTTAATMALGSKFLTPLAGKLAAKVPFVGDFIQKATAGAVDQGVQGAGMATGSQLGENVGNGDAWNQNLASAAGHGFVGGAVAGAALHPIFHPKSALDGANEGVKTGDPAGDAANSVGSSVPRLPHDPTVPDQNAPRIFPGGVEAQRGDFEARQKANEAQGVNPVADSAQTLGYGATDAAAPNPALQNIHGPQPTPIQSIIDQNTGVARAPVQSDMKGALDQPTPFMIHDPQTGVEIRPATLGDVIEASHNTDDANAQKQAEIKQQGGVALAESKFGPRGDIIHAPSGQPVPGAHAWAGDEHTTTDEFNRAQAKVATKELAKSDVQHDLEHVFVDAWREHNPMDRPKDADGLGPHPTPKELDQFTKLIGVGDIQSHADAVMKIDLALKKLERSKAESSDFKRGVLNEWRKKLIGENNVQDASNARPEGGESSATQGAVAAEGVRTDAQGNGAQGDAVPQAGSGEARQGTDAQGTEGTGLQEQQPADVRAGSAEAGEVSESEAAWQAALAEPHEPTTYFSDRVPTDADWDAAIRGEAPKAYVDGRPLDATTQNTLVKVKKRRSINGTEQLRGQEQAPAGDVAGRSADVGSVSVRPAGELRQSDGVEAGAARVGSVRSEGAADRSPAGDAAVRGGRDAAGRAESGAEGEEVRRDSAGTMMITPGGKPVRGEKDTRGEIELRDHHDYPEVKPVGGKEPTGMNRAQNDVVAYMNGEITRSEMIRRLQDRVRESDGALKYGHVNSITQRTGALTHGEIESIMHGDYKSPWDAKPAEAAKQEAGEEVAHPRFVELAKQLFPGKNAARDLSIFAAVHDGSAIADVASQHGLTEGRISQLTNEAWRKQKAAEIPQAMKNIGMEPEELMKLFHDEAAKRRAKAEADEALERAAVGDKAYEIQQELGYGESSLAPNAGDRLGHAELDDMTGTGTVTAGGSKSNVADGGDHVTQWAKLREKQEDLVAKGKHAEADAIQEKLDALEAQIRKRGFESEMDDEHGAARTAWEKQELHQESGVKFDDLPSSLKGEWHDALKAGTANRDRFAGIVDKYDNGMYEYDSRTSPGFKEIAENNADTVRDTEREYDRLGITHALDAATEYHVFEPHQFDGDGYAVADPNGGMKVGISREVSDNGGALLAHTLRHEVGHVVDDIGHGGVYSIQPEMRFSLGEHGWEGSGEVAREVDAMFKSGDPLLEGLFDYPLNRDAYPMSRKRLQGEVFSQLWSMYTNPTWRAKLEQYAPATAKFMKEVVENVKRNPEALQHGTESHATGRGIEFAVRDTQGRTEGAARSEQGGLDEGGRGEPAEPADAYASHSDERLRELAAAANARRAARSSTRDAEQAAAASSEGTRPTGFDGAPGRAERVISKLPEAAQGPVRRIYDNLAHVTGVAAKAIRFGHDLANLAEKTAGMKTPREYMDAISRKDAYRNALNAHIAELGTEASKLKPNERRMAGDYLTDTTMWGKWGYEADWNKGVTVDPSTKARFDKLPTNVQEVIKSLNKEGVEQQQREFVALKEASQRAGVEMPKGVEPRMDGPYFPLRRHGEFVVEAKSHEYLAAERDGAQARLTQLKQDANHYYYGHEASQALANEVKRQLDMKFGSQNVKAMARDKYYSDTHGASFATVDAWAEKIRKSVSEQEGVDPAAADDMAKMLKELMLQKMADNSARASNLKRGNVVGVKGEQALMSFFMNGQNRNRMVSEAVHGDAINKAQAAMSREVRETTDPKLAKERQDFANEFAARRIQQMKNEPSRVMDNLLQFNSVWRLLSSPAHYLQYLSQPVTMALPILQGRYGYAHGWRELHSGLQDAIAIAKSSSWVKPDLAKHVNKVGDEVGMLRALQARNILEHGSDLEAGRPAVYSDNAASAAFHTVTGKMSQIPRTLETHNRILSALAAYRLAFKDAERAGKSATDAHDAGVKFATDTIMSAYGDYSAANAPRALASANPLLRLATQYKKFHVLHGSMVVNLARESFKGATPEERAIAQKSLAFMAGHYGVLAGAAGVPGAMLVAGAIKNLFGDEHDKAMSTESYIRQAVGDSTIGDFLTHGVPGVMGVNAERKIGAGDIFDPLVKPLEIASSVAHGEIPTRAQLGDAALAVAGPTGGTAINMLGGVGQMMKGDWYGGLAAMMPKGIQDGLKAYGLATDGFADKKGTQRIAPENLSTADIAAQAVGIQPKSVADAQRVAKDEQTDEAHYTSKFNEMATQFQRALKDGDAGTMADVQKQFAETATEMSQNGMKPPAGSMLFRGLVSAEKQKHWTQRGVQGSARNYNAIRSRLLAEGQDPDE
jgi:hypothetical protein